MAATRRFIAAFLLGVLSLAAMGATHCKPEEVTYFSCKIRNSANVVSLCGSSLQGSDSASFLKHGWLQYRFGKPEGSSVFAYPLAKRGSVRHFVGESHGFLDEGNARGWNDRVWFRNRDVEYGLILDQGSQHFHGVRVNTGEKHRSLPCRKSEEIDPSGEAFTSLARHLSASPAVKENSRDSEKLEEIHRAGVALYRKRCSRPYRVENRPIANIHDSATIDTIRTLFCAGLEISTYRANSTNPPTDIPGSVALMNPKRVLPYQLKVGVSRTTVEELLGVPDHEVRSRIDYHVWSEGPGADVVSFEFRGGRVRRVLWSFHIE